MATNISMWLWEMSKKLTAWSGVVPMKAKSCPSSTLYVGLSRLSSMARDCSRVNELLRWLVGWWRLLKIKERKKKEKENKQRSKFNLCYMSDSQALNGSYQNLWGACVNSRSWLAIISRSEGADMLRRKTGCFTKGITVLASDTDFEAEKRDVQVYLLSPMPSVN